MRLWDLPSGKERAQLAHPAGIECMTFSHDGRLLATGDDKGAIRIWELAPDQKPVPITGDDMPAPLAFLHRGRTLAVWNGDCLSYWDLEQPMGEAR